MNPNYIQLVIELSKQTIQNLPHNVELDEDTLSFTTATVETCAIATSYNGYKIIKEYTNDYSIKFFIRLNFDTLWELEQDANPPETKVPKQYNQQFENLFELTKHQKNKKEHELLEKALEGFKIN